MSNVEALKILIRQAFADISYHDDAHLGETKDPSVISIMFYNVRYRT